MHKNNPKRIILVTGGCGYLGSQLIRDIASDRRIGSAIIRILDNMQTGGYQALLNLPSEGEYQYIEGDILDHVSLRSALDGVDTVIHLAAIVRTPLNFENSAWIRQVNYAGTSRLVEACLEAKVRYFIFASSAVIYGPGGTFNETDPYHPLGPYAQSKQLAEKYVLATSQRGLGMTILRFGTLYGLAPVIRYDAVANRFCFLAGTKRTLSIHGRGDQQRPFIHVKDASSVIRFCLTYNEMTCGEIFNASSENTSILKVAESIQDLQPGVRIHYTEQDILTHLSFEISNEKLQKLGWDPKVNLRDGLSELLSNYTSFTKAIPVNWDQEVFDV